MTQQIQPVIRLELPPEVVNIILQGLGEVPTKLGMPCAQLIQRQAGPQIAALSGQGAVAANEPPAAEADPVAAAAAEAVGKPVAKKVARKRVAKR
jgi:hypothetical protein